MITELQVLGYVDYKPSCHPKEGSTITWRETINEGIGYEKQTNIQLGKTDSDSRLSRQIRNHAGYDQRE